MRLTHKFFFIAITIFFSSAAIALPTDEHQVIHISADSTQFTYKTASSIYEGNVKITQGGTTLTADRVVTYSNNQHKLIEAIAYGTHQLAEYSTTPKPGDAVLHARAKLITFFPLKSTVILQNNVVVTQAENSFQGTLIIYNIKDQTISAPALKGGRSTIVIEPS